MTDVMVQQLLAAADQLEGCIDRLRRLQQLQGSLEEVWTKDIEQEGVELVAEVRQLAFELLTNKPESSDEKKSDESSGLSEVG